MQREVAEGVDLGPLAEVVHVLDRQRVEAEDVGEERQVLGGGLVEVEPEELAVREVLVRARGPRDRATPWWSTMNDDDSGAAASAMCLPCCVREAALGAAGRSCIRGADDRS